MPPGNWHSLDRKILQRLYFLLLLTTIMKTIPKTFEQFKSVMAYEFQGIDPEHDMRYWKLWQNSNLWWQDFLHQIRIGAL